MFTKLTKAQWWSVAKNVVFAGVAAAVAASQSGTAARPAALIGAMAALKIVEKALTPAGA